MAKIPLTDESASAQIQIVSSLRAPAHLNITLILCNLKGQCISKQLSLLKPGTYTPVSSNKVEVLKEDKLDNQEAISICSSLIQAIEPSTWLKYHLQKNLHYN